MNKPLDALLLVRVRKLMDKKVINVRFGYGGELHLHCGRFKQGKRVEAKKFGTWILNTRGTNYEIITSTETIALNDVDDAVIENKAKIFLGSKITDVVIEKLTLTLTFSNKCKLCIVATKADDKYGIPYWELFMPKHEMIVYGPLAAWNIKKSNVPVTNL